MPGRNHPCGRLIAVGGQRIRAVGRPAVATVRSGQDIVAFYLVEDDPAVADALKSLLTSAGHNVMAFGSAEAFLSDGPPAAEDTVVVDLGLPGISGSMLVRWLRALRTAPRVIVISGKASTAIEREMGDIPRLSILRKPPQADWLRAITDRQDCACPT